MRASLITLGADQPSLRMLFTALLLLCNVLTVSSQWASNSNTTGTNTTHSGANSTLSPSSISASASTSTSMATTVPTFHQDVEDMVYFTLSFGFEEGEDREPTQEEIEELVCITNRYIQGLVEETLREKHQDERLVQAFAVNIDWEYRPGDRLAIDLFFAGDVTYAVTDAQRRVDKEIVFDAFDLQVEQITDYIVDWVWQVTSNSIFYNTVRVNYNVRRTFGIRPGKLNQASCDYTRIPTIMPLTQAPSPAPSLSVSPTQATPSPTLSSPPSSSPTDTSAPTLLTLPPETTQDLVYWSLLLDLTEGINPSLEAIQGLLCSTNRFFQTQLQNYTHDQDLQCFASNIYWLSGGTFNATQMTVYFTSEATDGQGQPVGDTDILDALGDKAQDLLYHWKAEVGQTPPTTTSATTTANRQPSLPTVSNARDIFAQDNSTSQPQQLEHETLMMAIASLQLQAMPQGTPVRPGRIVLADCPTSAPTISPSQAPSTLFPTTYSPTLDNDDDNDNDDNQNEDDSVNADETKGNNGSLALDNMDNTTDTTVDDPTDTPDAGNVNSNGDDPDTQQGNGEEGNDTNNNNDQSDLVGTQTSTPTVEPNPTNNNSNSPNTPSPSSGPDGSPQDENGTTNKIDPSPIQVDMIFVVSNIKDMEDPDDIIYNGGIALSWPIFVRDLVQSVRLLRPTGLRTRRLAEPTQQQEQHRMVDLKPGSARVVRAYKTPCGPFVHPDSTCHELYATYALDFLPDQQPSQVDQSEIKRIYQVETYKAINDGTYQSVMNRNKPDSPIVIGTIPLAAGGNGQEPKNFFQSADNRMYLAIAFVLFLCLILCCCICVRLFHVFQERNDKNKVDNDVYDDEVGDIKIHRERSVYRRQSQRPSHDEDEDVERGSLHSTRDDSSTVYRESSETKQLVVRQPSK
jgi:hypothetical protein